MNSARTFSVVALVFMANAPRGAVLASMAAGIFTLLVWLALGYNVVIQEVFPSLGVSTLAYVLLANVSEQRVDLARLVGSP